MYTVRAVEYFNWKCENVVLEDYRSGSDHPVCMSNVPKMGLYSCRFAQRYNSTNDNMVQNLKSPVSFIFVFASHLSLHLIAHHRCQVGAMLVAPINVGVMISSRLQAFQFLSTCSFSSPTLPWPPSPWPPGSSCQGLLSGTYRFSIMRT